MLLIKKKTHRQLTKRKGRVKTSVYLKRVGVIHDQARSMSMFYDEDEQNLDHLFLHCKKSVESLG